MISIGVQSEGNIEYHAFRQVSFYEGFLAFANIMFGFSASLISFFPFKAAKLIPIFSCTCDLLRPDFRNSRSATFPQVIGDASNHRFRHVSCSRLGDLPICRSRCPIPCPIFRRSAYEKDLLRYRNSNCSFFPATPNPRPISLTRYRCLLLVLLLATLLANMSMFECCVVRVTCIETALWVLEHGLESPASFGSLLGLLQSQSLDSTIF